MSDCRRVRHADLSGCLHPVIDSAAEVRRYPSAEARVLGARTTQAVPGSADQGGMSSAPRVVRWSFLILGAWLVFAQTRNVFFSGIDAGPLFQRFAHDVVTAAAGALCIYRAVHHRAERLPWALIGAGVLCWTFGEIYYSTVLWTVEIVPVPSPADAGYLLMPPLVLAGLVLLMRTRTVGVPGTLRADGVTAALAIGAVSAAIVFETALDAASGDPLGVATTLAYPLFDLVLVGFVVGALAGTRMATGPDMGAARRRRAHLLDRRLLLPRPGRDGRL